MRQVEKKYLLQKIQKHAYYKNIKIDDITLEEYGKSLLKYLGKDIDKNYFSFIQECNGFWMNGLSFYGSKAISELFIEDALIQNEFWRSEILKLNKYFILGDADMDFYCYDLDSKKYVIVEKGSCSEQEVYTDLYSLLSKVIRLYE